MTTLFNITRPKCIMIEIINLFQFLMLLFNSSSIFSAMHSCFSLLRSLEFPSLIITFNNNDYLGEIYIIFLLFFTDPSFPNWTIAFFLISISLQQICFGKFKFLKLIHSRNKVPLALSSRILLLFSLKICLLISVVHFFRAFLAWIFVPLFTALFYFRYFISFLSFI